MLLGFVLSKNKILKTDFSNVFSSYVFFIALPSEIFLVSANTENTYKNEVVSYLFCYVIVICILWSFIWILYKYKFKRSLVEIGLNFIAIGQTNTAYLAIPIFIYFFGNAQLVIPVIIFQTIILTTISIVVIELDDSYYKLSITSILKRTIKIIIKNPLILASIIGFCMRYIPIKNILIGHNFVIENIRLIAQTAMPIALIALGASFVENESSKFNNSEIREIICGVILKNFAQPIFAFIIGKYLFHLSNTLLFGVTLILLNLVVLL